MKLFCSTISINKAYCVNLNIIPFVGDMRLDEVNVSTIQPFYDWMAHAGEHGRKKNLNRKTIERVRDLISRIFKVVCEMNLSNESPFKKTLLKIKAEPAHHSLPSILVPSALTDMKKRSAFH